MLFRKQIPNLVTLLNLLSGSIAIVFAFENNLAPAALLIFLSAAFDFLDGFLARILKAQSIIGKQLDGFADMISFGLAPAAILYKMIAQSLVIQDVNFSVESSSAVEKLILIIPFSYTLFAAIRLAIFSADNRQANQFIGLPTPAGAILIATLAYIVTAPDSLLVRSFIINDILNEDWIGILMNLYFLIPLTLVLSALMVLPIPFLAIKFNGFGFKKNYLQYIIILIGIISILLIKVIAIPLIILVYIALSLVFQKQRK